MLVTFGNCVLKTGVIKWPLKLCVRVFTFFFQNPKIMIFKVFFRVVAHVFSNTDLHFGRPVVRRCYRRPRSTCAGPVESGYSRPKFQFCRILKFLLKYAVYHCAIGDGSKPAKIIKKVILPTISDGY